MTQPILNIAIQAIKKAGDFIIKKYEFLNRIHKTLSPKHMNFIIYKINNESNHIIVTIIKKFYPLHTTNIEKNNNINHKKCNNNNIHWIIESIDNHINFIKQFPFFALSIAVQRNTQIEIGVIYDPIRNELFSACRGKGAQCNGYRIRLNDMLPKHLHNTILSISCLHPQHKTPISLMNKLQKQYNFINYRYTGSIILDLAYTAIGRIDGCFILSLKNTNKLSSGILIVQESGGLITDYFGNSISNCLNPKNIIVGHSKIIKIISSSIQQYIKETNLNK